MKWIRSMDGRCAVNVAGLATITLYSPGIVKAAPATHWVVEADEVAILASSRFQAVARRYFSGLELPEGWVVDHEGRTWADLRRAFKIDIDEGEVVAFLPEGDEVLLFAGTDEECRDFLKNLKLP